MAECVRRAWLVWQGQTMPLEDPDAGYVCEELNLGWPEVRENTNPRPDASGTIDMTRYFAGRAVSANIRALASLGGAPVDDLAARFGRYMTPDIRPELHYVLERPGNPERVLVVRAAGYSWPINGTGTRDIQLSWVAPDPYALDVADKTATAWAGSSTSPGRNYDLRFNRIYPPGGGEQVNARIDNTGEVPVSPVVRIYGPITGPTVYLWAMYPDGGQDVSTLTFRKPLVVGSGEFVEVDCANHTALLNGDPSQSVLGQMDWPASRWFVFAPSPVWHSMALFGDSTAGVTSAVASFREAFLT